MIARDHAVLEEDDFSFAAASRFLRPRDAVKGQNVTVAGRHLVRLHRVASMADDLRLQSQRNRLNPSSPFS